VDQLWCIRVMNMSLQLGLSVKYIKIQMTYQSQGLLFLKIQWKPFNTIPLKVSQVTYHSNLIPKFLNMINVYTAPPPPRIHFLLKTIFPLQGNKSSQSNEFVNLPMCSASKSYATSESCHLFNLSQTHNDKITLSSPHMSHTVWHVAYFWCVSSVLLVSECICCLHLHGKSAKFISSHPHTGDGKHLKNTDTFICTKYN
jgi:hypothetical protein